MNTITYPTVIRIMSDILVSLRETVTKSDVANTL